MGIGILKIRRNVGLMLKITEDFWMNKLTKTRKKIFL